MSLLVKGKRGSGCSAINSRKVMVWSGHWEAVNLLHSRVLLVKLNGLCVVVTSADAAELSLSSGSTPAEICNSYKCNRHN